MYKRTRQQCPVNTCYYVLVKYLAPHGFDMTALCYIRTEIIIIIAHNYTIFQNIIYDAKNCIWIDNVFYLQRTVV